MTHQCYNCHLKAVDQLITKFNPSLEVADALVLEAKEILEQQKTYSNAFLATKIHRLASRKINCSVLYHDEKLRANKILLDNYEYWKSLVNESDDPKYTALKLAVAGNIIDYGAHTEPDDIVGEVKEIITQDFSIDDSDDLFDRIARAKKIVYLGDNAGEIVFDKLLLETIGHPNVCYVVRGKPVINDVTIEDAQLTGINHVCKVITNGYDAPSTLLEYCSNEFIDEFEKADLIISKGQGNFEGLMNEDNYPIFFLLMAKCKPVAELLGTNVGGLIAKGNSTVK